MKQQSLSFARILLARFASGTRLAVLLAATALATAPPAVAQEIPWRRVSFDLQAVNEPLNVFLTRLLTLQGISITTSGGVATGRVNGRFKGQTEAVFRELAETYGLTWYYDGTTLHVYSLAELETRLMQVEPVDIARIDRTLKQMRLADGRYPLRLSPDEGTVLVSGPPKYVELVAGVVARVAGAPSLAKNVIDVRVFRLRYARAADTTVAISGVDTTIPGIASILNDIVGSLKPTPQAGARTTPRSLPGLRGKGQAAIGRNAQTTGQGNTAAAANAVNAVTAAAAAGMATRSDIDSPMTNAGLSSAMAGTAAGMMLDARQGAPEAEPAPQREAAVRADPRLNAVIVRDTADRMPMYARLIESLDVDVPLMEIEATVIDVADDKSEALGIDWRAHSSRADISSSPNGLAGTGTGTAPGGRGIANDLLFTDNPLSAGKGLVGTLIFGSARQFFLARLNALTERGDAKLISRPRVLTLDNMEAVLQSTREFYVRVAGRDQVDLFNVSLGLTMRVTPTLVEDAQGRRFKLQVRIEDGNTNSGQQVDQIPVVNRNAIATQAVVGDGQSLLIGGYVIEERRDGRSGVPILSDVPGLHWLFGQRSGSTSRVERLFMITPRLVSLSSLTSAAAATATATASVPMSVASTVPAGAAAGAGAGASGPVAP